METGQIIALGSLVVALTGFLIGRLTASKKDGQQVGVILTKLNDLTDNITRLEKQIDKISDRLDNRVATLQKDQNALRDRLASLEGRVAVPDGGSNGRS
jgi:hypothetical protein